MNKKNFRTPIVYLLLLLAIILMATFFDPFGSSTKGEAIDYSTFMEYVKNSQVEAIVIDQQSFTLYGIKNGSSKTADMLPKGYDFSTTFYTESELNNDLRAVTSGLLDKAPDTISSSDYQFKYDYVKPTSFSIGDILPFVMIIGAFIFVWFMVMRQQGGGSGGINSFGKSKARVITNETNKVTFADVAGADEEKEELAEIVEFLRNPTKFTSVGARIPKGVLLMGPPGTGKTLLAKAVAGEAGAPFYSISGSDFVEMFVGVGASRVRDLFTTAKKTAPAIIFIDEIDAVGRHRGAGLGGGHDEREQTLNQLLVEMDGFDPHSGIIVIAATNRPDILDPALLRPGRFDRQIVVNIPDVKGREEILKVHARGKPFADNVDLSIIAKRTPGFTGADLENVLNESAILTARKDKKKIEMPFIEEAITRVIAGPEKKSRIITPEDKRITAIHEAGHAIVSRGLPGCDPVHEISIIQRGRAAGYTMTIPEKDRQHTTRSKLIDEVVMLMGGRVAEAVYIGDISTGASNDIQRATEIARRMVTEFGMSDKLGPLFLGGGQEVFLGKELGHARSYSEDFAGIIDEEISSIIETSYKKAEQILTDAKPAMEAVSQALIEHERLNAQAFEKLYCEAMNIEYKNPPVEDNAKADEKEAEVNAELPTSTSAEQTPSKKD